MSITLIPRTYSHHWRAPFQSPVDSWHQSSRALWCKWYPDRGTCDLSPAVSRQFPMVLGDTGGATCSQSSSLDAARRPPLIAQYINLDMRLYYVANQNLVYVCGNVPQTTTQSSDTLLIPCVNMYINPSICPSSFLQVKWLKLFNRSMYSSEGHSFTLKLMFQTVFTSQAPQLLPAESKQRVQRQAIWSPITVTNQSIFLMYPADADNIKSTIVYCNHFNSCSSWEMMGILIGVPYRCLLLVSRILV